ncbi:RES family NAD+ phosphorylase [Paraglaciecola aquimarina]|uniref:RES family NAD+ phosphorylase n=1 Tax=Paraglaciecola algarum TaxID=3050085 RepID=A0ABS9D600_9ALTE|nr:RES family NAD+ phosphorylase [Paraglaciecola sp. G1-23]MCF2948205.1 RES family NAD+ phosphorylase [Paraglaciecola sp. G1-23]
MTNFKQEYVQSSCPVTYKKHINRLIETQEIAATTSLVDDLDEQFVLEQMLDEVKPQYRPGTEHMHYLLKTPFRYPPLKYGSRFGTRTLPSFFYAGEGLHGTLGEVAYYRFVFLQHMQIPYTQAIRSQHMSFRVEVATQECADLTLTNFEPLKERLTSVNNYDYCQKAGHWLVDDQGIQVIRYHSARILGAVNVAIAQPIALVSTEPEQCQNWLCLTQVDKVSFTSVGNTSPVTFYREDFLCDGELPIPA